MKKWQCSVCKYIHSGDQAPEKCPVCGVEASKFVPIEDDAATNNAKEETPIADEKETGAPEKEAAGAKETANDTKQSKETYAKIKSRVGAYMEKAAELMLKHHAHPITVHIPNGVIPVVATLFILSWIFGSALLAKAAFINLVFVIIAMPKVILTGVLEWKRKYNQAQTTIFKIKIGAAVVTTICCVASIIWYLVNPNVLESSSAWGFVAVNLLMLAAAGVAGHIGGKLIFKD